MIFINLGTLFGLVGFFVASTRIFVPAPSAYALHASNF